jgi:hypothetical protein
MFFKLKCDPITPCLLHKWSRHAYTNLFALNKETGQTKLGTAWKTARYEYDIEHKTK